jgi:hypothetical protein
MRTVIGSLKMVVWFVLTISVGNIFCTAQTSVLTWHNDNWRTGQNNQETTLTTTLVGNKNQFGKVCTATLNGALGGKIQAQPLVVANVKIGTITYASIAYVVTNTDAVWAIDNTCAMRKNAQLLPNQATGETPANCNDIPCHQGTNQGPFSGTVGILGTPVIHLDTTNPATGTMYVVTESECPAQTACNQNSNKSNPLGLRKSQFADRAKHQWHCMCRREPL